MDRSSAWWIPPLAAGVAIRLWGLGRQILGGDELHAVRAAVAMPVAEILVSYRQTDHCIPLSALFRVMLDAGLQLSEWWLRAPSLMAGALLLLLAPRLAARRIGRRSAALLAWLLALSPMLVLYSGTVRSYSAIAVLGLLAVLAFEAWWREGDRRAAAGYVAAATAAVWFHLGSAPFVLAPLAFAATQRLLGERRGAGERPGWRGLLAVGLGTAAVLAVFLVPARSSLLPLLESKRRDLSLPLDTVVGQVLALQAGTSERVLAVFFWGLTLSGLLVLCRRQAAFGLYTAWLVAAQMIGLLVLSPVGLAEPLIFSRYLVPALPLVLVWTAVGMDATGQLVSRRGGSWAGRTVAPALVVLLALGGPLFREGFRCSSFQHHNDFLDFAAPRAEVRSEEVPAFYVDLASSRSPGAVLELPWHPTWRFVRSFYAYQAVHHRRVVVGSSHRFLGAPRTRWANTVPLLFPFDIEALLDSRARFAVLHLDLGSEEARLSGPPGDRSPRARAAWSWLRGVAANLSPRLEAALGPPLYADASIRVWDLDAARHR